MRQKLHRRRTTKANRRATRIKAKSPKKNVENMETVYPIFFDFAESDDEMILRTELPGVSVEPHQLKVEPHRIKILTAEGGECEQGDGPEGRRKELPQVLDLPIQVNPSLTTASLNCGLLELRMPRPHLDQDEQVLLKAS